MALIKRIIQIPDKDAVLVEGDGPAFKDHITGDEVTAEKGAHYWAVLSGHETPKDRKEEEYCNTIHRIYLNWETAPWDYIIERHGVLRDMYKGTAVAGLLQRRYDWAIREMEAENG